MICTEERHIQEEREKYLIEDQIIREQMRDRDEGRGIMFLSPVRGGGTGEEG